MKNKYLIGNIFEDDLIHRKIKTNPELIFKELERLKIENNQLQQQADIVSMISDLKQDLKPVIKFHNSVTELEPEPKKKRISSKKREKLEVEAHLNEVNKALYAEWVKGVSSP